MDLNRTLFPAPVVGTAPTPQHGAGSFAPPGFRPLAPHPSGPMGQPSWAPTVPIAQPVAEQPGLSAPTPKDFSRLKYGPPAAYAPSQMSSHLSPEEVALFPTYRWPSYNQLYGNAPAAEPNNVQRPPLAWIRSNPVSSRGQAVGTPGAYVTVAPPPPCFGTFF